MTTRRQFIAGLGAAAAWPPPARGQQRVPVVGLLDSGSAGASAPFVAALRRGLEEHGYVEGQSVAIEYRWADGEYDRLAPLAEELVRRPVTVIAATGSANAATAAKTSTVSIPIVFANGGDPVSLGLVASLNRPGSNVTGVSFYNGVLDQKRVGLLRELVPGARSIAVLANPTNPNTEIQLRDLEAAAAILGQQLRVLNASTDDEVDGAFAALSRKADDALIVAADAFFTSRRTSIIRFAASLGMPALYANSDYPAVGGLMSYGSTLAQGYHDAGVYIGRILKGDNPADLPVMLPTKFELVINLKTAKALGLTIPNSLQLLADEVIE